MSRANPRVTFESPESLVAWSSNPKPHDDLEVLVRSIEQFGFRSVVVVRPSDNRILAGHGRTLAALQLGIKKVPVLWADMSDEDAAAFAVVDNIATERSRWDEGVLADVLRELEAADYDLDVVGLHKQEIDVLLGRWVDPFADEVRSESPEIVDDARAKVTVSVPIAKAQDAFLLVEKAFSEARWSLDDYSVSTS